MGRLCQKALRRSQAGLGLSRALYASRRDPQQPLARSRRDPRQFPLEGHPSVPAKSAAELVAYAKANPGKLNCASAGIGTAPHLACEYLNKLAGANIVHV